MAVSDIRLSVDFFQHPKTIKLERRLGIEGVKALLSLWMWAAQNRPDGVLSGMDPEDIEIAAGWTRSDQDLDLVSTLVALRWLDEENGTWRLHEWEVHNPWAAGQQSRSNQARLGVLARRFPHAYARYTARHPERNGISKEEYEALLAMEHSEEPEADAVLAPASPQQTNSVAPLPDPDPEPKAIDPQLCTGLSTVLSTGLSTSEGPKDQKPPAKGKDTEREELQKAMELMRSWAGYRPVSEAWLRQAVANYPRLSIPDEIEEARRWVLKRNMAVKNPKAFMLEWFRRVAAERG